MAITTPQRQFKVDQIDVQLYTNKEDIGTAAAALVARQLQQAIDDHGVATLVVATGNSQFEFLNALVQVKTVPWNLVDVFHLDEYLGISVEHPASFRRYLQERLFNHVAFRSVHLLKGDTDVPEAECKRYSALLSERDIDVACIGIGENGHLAFNDPPADFETEEKVHVVTLDEACRQQQVGEGHFPTIADVPAQALSMSIPAILSARVISCVVPDERKADAIKCTLEGPITPMCPASILRTHPRCNLFLDADSASKLSI